MPLLSQRSAAAASLARAHDDATLPAILEFSSPSSAIIEGKVPLLARGTVWVIGGLLAACLLAMELIPVDRVVTAPGRVVSRVPTIVVQPLETSIVRAIEVTEGESMHAGDLLARLDPTFTAADVGASESQVSALAAEVSRLEAEAAGRPFDYEGADPNLSLQAAIYAQRQSERKLKRETYRQRISGLQAAIDRSAADVQSYRARLAVADQVLNMRKTLGRLQVGTVLNSLAATDNQLEIARGLSNATQSQESAPGSGSHVRRTRHGRGELADRSFAEAFRTKTKARRRPAATEQGSVAPPARGAARQPRWNRPDDRQGLRRVRGANGRAADHLGPPPTCRSKSKQTSSGATTPSCVTAVAIKFDSFPFSLYSLAEGAGADDQRSQFYGAE